MVVLGAVFVESLVIQPLTDYIWLGVHPSNDRQLLRNARILLALRRSLDSLDKFYTGLSIPKTPTSDPNRFYPYVRSYPTADGRHVEFNYVKKLMPYPYLAPQPIFQAKMVEGDLIVVKFVQRYNADSHRLLAARKLAPSLLYSGPDAGQTHGNIGGLEMIVMEFIVGVTASDVYNYLPGPIFAQVQEAVEALHEEGYVFGDLRLGNIMVADGKAFLIDFDWCAKEEVGRYPVSLNDADSEIGWHREVARNGVMRKSHDLFMLQKLRAPE